MVANFHGISVVSILVIRTEIIDKLDWALSWQIFGMKSETHQIYNLYLLYYEEFAKGRSNARPLSPHIWINFNHNQLMKATYI